MEEIVVNYALGRAQVLDRLVRCWSWEEIYALTSSHLEPRTDLQRAVREEYHRRCRLRRDAVETDVLEPWALELQRQLQGLEAVRAWDRLSRRGGVKVDRFLGGPGAYSFAPGDVYWVDQIQYTRKGRGELEARLHWVEGVGELPGRYRLAVTLRGAYGARARFELY